MQTESSYKPLIWYLCCIGIILLSVLTFTPLVIPAYQADPAWYGIPYTLWTGIAMAVLIMLVNVVAALCYPAKENEGEEKS